MVRINGQGDGTSLIQVRGIDKTYQRGSEEIHVLQGLNLDVDTGDFAAFMGPSGSGKTVLMVTHDPLAAERAHVVVHLEKGVLVDALKTQRAR